MAKFMVGDIVRGTLESDKHYGYTNSNMVKGEVVKLDSGDRIVVKVLEHKKDDSALAMTFGVHEDYFELASDSESVGGLLLNNVKGVKVEQTRDMNIITIDESLVISIPSYGRIGMSSVIDGEEYVEEIGKALAFYRHKTGGRK